MPLAQRIERIQAVVEALKQRRDEIVNVLMWEICKNQPDAAAEFDRTMEFIAKTIETLRSLPHALLSRGYRCAARVANKARSLELSARGPPSARSSPGPLRASDSPGQRWDVPTQVRARYAARAGHGARLGPPAG